MPRYDYECSICGVFEVKHGMDNLLLECPDCKGGVRRLMSKVNIQCDAITPYYHPAAQMWCESKGQLQQLDEATGCTTYDYNKKPDITPEQKRAAIDRELTEDRTRAWNEAIERYDTGNLNLTEEQRAICKQRNNQIAHQTGKDSFKNNGKEYRLRTPE